MKKLKVGDEVLIRVRRAAVADPPKKAMAADPMNIERNERQEFKWVKSRYLKLRRKLSAHGIAPTSKNAANLWSKGSVHPSTI
jgi:hypothetical protein